MCWPDIDSDACNGMLPSLAPFFAGKYKSMQALLVQNG